MYVCMYVSEYYFQFRFRPVSSHRYAILSLPVKFHSNQSIVGGVMMSSIFQDGGQLARVVNLFSDSVLAKYSFKKVEIYLSTKFRRLR